jgi:predicted metal-binding membrane protein
MMLSDRIRAMGAPHWLALFGLILGAWIMLYAMALPTDLRQSARIFGAEFWESLCLVTPDAAGFGRVVLMWALMAAAMMAPTALPAFATYEDLGRSTDVRFGALVAGYLAVWLGFSVLAGGLQMVLFSAGLISAFGDSLSVWLSAGLLLVAGLYQFSPVKEACLSKCRAPLTFFMAHWDEGALRNGVRLGLVCLGCCWALMLLAFVGGVMNIAFMGLATLIMVIEKLPQYGRLLTRPLGVVLIAAGIFVALGAV